jgi:hypothetical protein
MKKVRALAIVATMALLPVTSAVSAQTVSSIKARDIEYLPFNDSWTWTDFGHDVITCAVGGAVGGAAACGAAGAAAGAAVGGVAGGASYAAGQAWNALFGDSILSSRPLTLLD